MNGVDLGGCGVFRYTDNTLNSTTTFGLILIQT